MGISCKFNLKEPNGHNETLINMFCSYNGKRLKYSTGEKVAPSKWSAKQQKVKASHRLADHINQTLNHIEQTAQKLIRSAQEQGSLLSEEELRRQLNAALKPSDRVEWDMLGLIEEYMKVKRPLSSPNTLKKFTTLKGHLLKFRTVHTQALTIEFVNSYRFGEQYKAFLLSELDLLDASIARDFKAIKSVLGWAVKSGYSKLTDYKQFKVKEPETNYPALTHEELTLFATVELKAQNLRNVRDVFIIQCHTGLRYSDLRKLNRESIQNGNLRIHTEKTHEPLSIPLESGIIEMLEAWDYKIPIVSNPKTNKLLKEVGRLAGITDAININQSKGAEVIKTTKPKYQFITTHTARRTFITRLVESDISLEVIRSLTGHRTYKELQKYVKLSDRSKRDAIRKAFPAALKIAK